MQSCLYDNISFFPLICNLISINRYTNENPLFAAMQQLTLWIFHKPCVFFPVIYLFRLKNANDVLRRPNKHQFEEQMLTKDIFIWGIRNKKEASIIV